MSVSPEALIPEPAVLVPATSPLTQLSLLGEGKRDSASTLRFGAVQERAEQP